MRQRRKALRTLPPSLRDELRARVASTSARSVARDLEVSDGLVRRALDGRGVTLAIHRLLTLTLTGAA